MDQKSIVSYLSLKGMTAVQIHADLVATLKGEAVSYGSVTRYLRSKSFIDVKNLMQNGPPDQGLSEIDEAILAALEEQPFASVRQLSRATHLASSTVYSHLTQKLGYTVRHLRWVPHILSEADKIVRAQLSCQLMELLEAQRRRSWHDIVTLDESWFYFTTDYERIWLPQDTSPPERERLTIQSKKMMVTIVWNPAGFCRIAALPKGSKFNTDYYISEILTPLAAWRAGQVGATDRKLIVHSDNARPHMAKKVNEFFANNGMTRAPHPPYSPDLAPCDFFLFGYIKERLKGRSFNDADQLLMAINGVCESIEKATLEKVFYEWRERLAKCLVACGGLVENT